MVETFSPAMIEEFLTRRGIIYTRGGDSFVANFTPHSERPYELSVQFCAEDSGTYVVRIVTPRYYPAEEGPALLALVNQWHAERRWPKVHLTPIGDATFVRFVTESYIGVSKGIHLDGLDEFSVIAFTASEMFFSWMEACYHPSSAPMVDTSELESWLREAS